MKKCFIILFLCILAFSGIAQFNQSLHYNPHLHPLSAKTFPGRIGQSVDKFAIMLPSVSLGIGNNFLTYSEIKDLATDELTNAEVESAIQSLQQSNRLFFEAEALVLGCQFNIKRKDKLRNLLSISLSFSERVIGSTTFSKKLVETAYEGNNQFVGELVDLSPLRADALYYHDLAFGVAVPIELKDSNKMTLTPGIRLRYLNGVASLNTEKAAFSYFTQEEGRFIRMLIDYKINTSFPEDEFSFWGNGNGFAIDLGGNLKVNDMISMDLAVNDIGFIRFAENAKNYAKNEVETYRGIEIDIWNEEVEEISTLDTLENLIEVDETSNPFNISLQPNISLAANLTFGKMAEKEYYRHNIYLFYQQGFSKVLDKSTKPVIGIAYTFSVNNIFNIGPNFTFGNYSGFSYGLHTSVKGGPFVFSLGSSNLSLISENGKGADLNMSMLLLF